MPLLWAHTAAAAIVAARVHLIIWWLHTSFGLHAGVPCTSFTMSQRQR
jgi:hypothetical protein